MNKKRLKYNQGGILEMITKLQNFKNSNMFKKSTEKINNSSILGPSKAVLSASKVPFKLGKDIGTKIREVFKKTTYNKGGRFYRKQQD
jgi:hypothetical protein